MVVYNEDNPLLDVLGRYRIKSLFYEHRHPKYPYYWTVRNADKKEGDLVIPSLKLIYLSYDHIPGNEYEFALDNFKTWEHWMIVRNSPLFKEMFEGWENELKIRIKSLQVKNLMKNAKEGDSSAAKYIVEDKLEGTKRGRPSKAERAAFLKQQSQEESELGSIGQRVTSLLERKKG